MPVIELAVNGSRHRVDADPERTLLSVLRERPRPDRDQVRLRRGPVRRLHGADRRQARALLPDQGRRARPASRSSPSRDWRRAASCIRCRRRSSTSGRDAVRLLHGGDDHGGRRRCCERTPDPERAGDRARHGRQRLPLRDLPARSSPPSARRRPCARGPPWLTATRPDRTATSAIEAERYELFAGPAYRFEVHRRDFFKVLGAGLVVAFALPSASRNPEARGAATPMPGDVSRLAPHRRKTGASPSSRARSRSARTSARRCRRSWRRSCARRSASITMVMARHRR